MNSKKYTVILSISNTNTYHEILSLNGGEKVRALLPSVEKMKWDILQMEQLILQNLTYWSEDDCTDLMSLCAPACSPDDGRRTLIFAATVLPVYTG